MKVKSSYFSIYRKSWAQLGFRLCLVTLGFLSWLRGCNSSVYRVREEVITSNDKGGSNYDLLLLLGTQCFSQ